MGIGKRLKIVSLLAGLIPALLLAAPDGATGDHWPSYGGTTFSWRYSALDQIHRDNVKRLVPAWVFQTGDYENGLQATPIVLDGVLYLSTSRNWVFALEAATGRQIWEYRYPVPKQPAPYGMQNRGVALGHGRVFMGTVDNHVVALDQKTGGELWRVNVEDVKQCGCNINGAPLVVKDKVIVGGTGGDSAHRGYLTAFDARTGRLAWRFFTIPGPGEKGHETWPGESWKIGGGAAWMTGSYDPELNLVYWGIGNAAAALYAGSRRGDNLYTGSIVALDADTGKLKWHHQQIPQDVWDYDASYECILVDLPFQGRLRKLLVQVSKSGYTWVLDRVTGEFLSAWPFVRHINWVTGITGTGKLTGRNEPEVGKAKLICPSAIGGKSWNQAAYSPRTGLLYSPGLELCNDLIAREEQPQPGKLFHGGSWTMRSPPGEKAYGFIAAYDPLTGRKQWTHLYPYFLLASVLATGGDLVFSGDPEGNFFALDARTGARLWSFPTGAGHRGSAVSYAVNGRQYIATPSGWGSLIGPYAKAIWPDSPPFRAGSSLFAFALPEGRP